jgi:hypothetical protein
MNNKVVDYDDLYRLSEKFEPEFDGTVLTIDNFYENPNRIHRHLMNREFPLWKYNPERDSRNGKDYYDCRIIDTIAHPTRLYYEGMSRIIHLCQKYWHKGSYNWDHFYEFNIYRPIKDYDNNFQHYPHTDSSFDTPDRLSTLNMIVYLDKIENGGTAVYDGEWITNDERFNLMYDVNSRFTLNNVIPAKFNRCVIFPGNRLHGAYIEDYKKYEDEENWRITQVRFLHPST